ncbi:uncharacterized protein CYBJADRAFT_36447 [Cyberlindnera jadinii NRRL Y-1542]|uniref:Uncharacterized protein n=1 Tax=Cyberlindnera jadinii (strain ATCC 18201 / CBS 1600 / BCRC 20928 / JCM 3617 / NBRC 0987 / NRRL Y-1542) TaxID=983966 RepID=A0A1E4RW46_CYBJN|nr:hypothetical protein CYBJADRAFT_36447 [Cyberlindnera jadinii NRRL Y-1542]ODV71305.1 hypothetical protein CYBJADRAFT_36447 [Cyberlindnera jadinii NRRL Y-1542]
MIIDTTTIGKGFQWALWRISWQDKTYIILTRLGQLASPDHVQVALYHTGQLIVLCPHTPDSITRGFSLRRYFHGTKIKCHCAQMGLASQNALFTAKYYRLSIGTGIAGMVDSTTQHNPISRRDGLDNPGFPSLVIPLRSYLSLLISPTVWGLYQSPSATFSFHQDEPGHQLNSSPLAVQCASLTVGLSGCLPCCCCCLP